jgi:hypothetical protein
LSNIIIINIIISLFWAVYGHLRLHSRRAAGRKALNDASATKKACSNVDYDETEMRQQVE